MPGKQEGKPIPHGLQPGKAREKAGLYNPANRNKAGRPPGSVNRYTGALKELFLQAADEVGDRQEIGPNGELDGNGGALAAQEGWRQRKAQVVGCNDPSGPAASSGDGLRRLMSNVVTVNR
jgi:hypothetical protein